MTERRLALVVATDAYDSPELRQLSAPVADAEALARVLGDPALGGFEVQVVRNGTSSEVAEHVDALLGERRPDDLVLLHFSCHGLKDDAGELYLAARNTVPTRLASTALDAAFVDRLVRRSRAGRVVLLLDCCYGGAFERGVVHRAADGVDVSDHFGTQALGGGRGRAVITASSATEFAFEGGVLADAAGPRPSVFTSALVEGLATGEADRDQDGRVALGELYDHVFDRVRAVTPDQTPCKWEFGLQGDLYIARNPHRRVRPAELPAELLEMAHSPTRAARLGAVAELAHLAQSEDVRLAAAAHEQLGRLVSDDSRRVSEAAREAVARTGTLVLPPDVVDLGRAEAGGPPLVVEVPVRGAPLALASPVASSRADVTAALDGGVLRVAVAPGQPGRIEADVTVDAPAGPVLLHVHAVVTAPGRGPRRVPSPRRTEQRPPDVRAAAAPAPSGGLPSVPLQSAPRGPAPRPSTALPSALGPSAPPPSGSEAAGSDVLGVVLLLLGGIGVALALPGLYLPARVAGCFVVPLVLLALALLPLGRGSTSALPMGVAAGVALLAVDALLGRLAADASSQTTELGLWTTLLLAAGLLVAGTAVLVGQRPALRGRPRPALGRRRLTGLVLGGLPLGVALVRSVQALAQQGSWTLPALVADAVLLVLLLGSTCLALTTRQADVVAVTAVLVCVTTAATTLAGAASSVSVSTWATSVAVYGTPSPLLVVPAVLVGSLLGLGVVPRSIAAAR